MTTGFIKLSSIVHCDSNLAFHVVFSLNTIFVFFDIPQFYIKMYYINMKYRVYCVYLFRVIIVLGRDVFGEEMIGNVEN